MRATQKYFRVMTRHEQVEARIYVLLPRDLPGAPVLPTSILYDSDGREVWRFVGDRDWGSAEAAKDLAAAK